MRCLKCIAPLIVVEILYNTFVLRVSNSGFYFVLSDPILGLGFSSNHYFEEVREMGCWKDVKRDLAIAVICLCLD